MLAWILFVVLWVLGFFMYLVSSLGDDESDLSRGIVAALWPIFMARALLLTLGRELWDVLPSWKRPTVRPAADDIVRPGANQV